MQPASRSSILVPASSARRAHAALRPNRSITRAMSLAIIPAGSTCFAQQDELALDGADGLFLLPELLQIIAL